MLLTIEQWQSQFTSWWEHLSGIISENYVDFNPETWDPRAAQGKHVVVTRRVLNTPARVRALDAFFKKAPNRGQSLIVNVLGALTLTMGQDHIPRSVRQLTVTNTDGSVTSVGEGFLMNCSQLPGNVTYPAGWTHQRPF